MFGQLICGRIHKGHNQAERGAYFMNLRKPIYERDAAVGTPQLLIQFTY